MLRLTARVAEQTNRGVEQNNRVVEQKNRVVEQKKPCNTVHKEFAMVGFMRQQVYDKVYKGPPKCEAGSVVNPRTARCVKTNLALGAAVDAAAKALMAGRLPAKDCGDKGAFEYESQDCVTDPPRVKALRDLLERWAVASATNGLEANYRSERARIRELEAIALGLQEQLDAAQRERSVCKKDLERVRATLRVIERQLLENNRR